MLCSVFRFQQLALQGGLDRVSDYMTKDDGPIPSGGTICYSRRL